ncbi:MAG: hypothetical protein ACLP3R_03770 [Candidatus Korobacteraceae bacterium]|jgi:P pilus assembly chaperone PapD
MHQEGEMLKKPARLAALVTLLLFSAAAFAGLLPDGQATSQTQTNANAKSSSKSGDQKKPALPPKDADKLAKEDKLSKERYSTRGLHPPDKTPDSSKQGSQAAGKSDAKDAK